MSVRQSDTPKALQIIKAPGLIPKEMHDDIARVDQDPVGLTSPFGDGPDHPLGFHSLKQMLGHGLQMPSGAACGDHHGICHAGLAGEIDGDGVDRFVVVKRCFDEMLEIVVQRFGSRLGPYDD